MGGHLAHGDRLGSCAEACPCFTSSGLAEVAAQCSVPVTAAQFEACRRAIVQTPYYPMTCPQ